MEKPLKTGISTIVVIVALFLPLHSGKQKLILQLREPLRPGSAELVIPAVTNYKGEVRDLRIQFLLGDSLGEARGIQEMMDPIPGVDLSVIPDGRQGFQIRMVLPQPAFVEVVLMDIYGKSLAVLFSGHCTLREMTWKHVFKEKDPGGLHIVAMKVDGKIAVKRVLPQVKQ